MRIAINAWFIDRPTTGSGQYLVHLLNEYAASCDARSTRSAKNRRGACSFLLCGRAHQAPPEASCFEWQVLRTPFDRLHRHLAKLWFEQVSFPRACRHWGARSPHRSARLWRPSAPSSR